MGEAPLDRREFLRRVGGAALMAAGISGAGLALHDRRAGDAYFRDAAEADLVCLKPYGVEPPAGAKRMAIVHGTDADKMVRAAVAELGGMAAYVRPGETVLIKPNVAFDRAPALGTTTSPEVLAAVARLCFEAGARRVIVADNPINQPEGCFHKSGIQAAAAGVGAEVMLPTPGRFETIAIGRRYDAAGVVSGEPGVALDRWPCFYEPLRLADKVIGIGPCKDHNLAGASMTMKNWYGLLGGRRNQFHQDIHGIISDFPLMIQPTLVVLDALRILMRHGPTGGSLADVKPGHTIAVSADMVALDAFGYTLLERREPPPEYLARAAARGLGTADWQTLQPVELTT